LTHFTEFQYVYLISRVRSANGFPKQIKSSTNPGGVGHVWVKERFVDPAPPNTVFTAQGGMTRIFIPSLLTDNSFLMTSDPDYQRRLEALPERDKRALLYGDWDIFEGQYFDEFDRSVHVCEPFSIPREWRRYIAIDYGLDMLAAYWFAVDNNNHCYAYKELCQPNLPIGLAAKAINDYTDEDEDIYAVLAPPDLWGRSQETGKDKATLFREGGLSLDKSSNDRESGWLALKELLRKREDGSPRLKIFSTCTTLIKHLPMLQRDPCRPTDTLNEPHEITHSCDAARYFAIYWVRGAKKEEVKKVKYRPDLLEDYLRATPAERQYMIERYGVPQL
jgi:phage terminase large subunit